MTERRSLAAGLKPFAAADPELEAQFVYGGTSPAKKPAPKPKPESAASPDESPPMPVPAGPTANATRPASVISRVPFTTRLRADLANALKRASLERQLEGVEPNTVQEMLESALEPWLKANGYLP